MTTRSPIAILVLFYIASLVLSAAILILFCISSILLLVITVVFCPPFEYFQCNYNLAVIDIHTASIASAWLNLEVGLMIDTTTKLVFVSYGEQSPNFKFSVHYYAKSLSYFFYGN